MDDALYDEMLRAQGSFHDQAMTIPGVHATSIGIKSAAGEPTGTWAIVVHTSKKKPLADLPLSERIPEQLGGFATDVIEHDPPSPAAADHLEGGADLRVSINAGTLGCMVRDLTDSTTCLLSNAHVLLSVGTTVSVDKNDVCHKVGTTKRTINDLYVDAAIASIGDTKWSPTIANIGDVKGARGLTWSDLGQPVQKMGRTTGLTSGSVTDLNYRGINALGTPVEQQVTISDSSGKIFADFGDSGSVVVDRNNFVVALFWGIGGTGDPAVTSSVRRYAACRIENVQTALNVEVLTPQTADAPPPYAETFAGQLEAFCAQSSRAQAYYQAFVQHRDEVEHLFHENARLYATWRKIPQDAFMDAFQAGVRNPTEIIPATLDGEETVGVLAQLRDAMSQHIEDPELMRQVDSLRADISNGVGGTWQQAIDRIAVPAQASTSHDGP